MTRRFAWGLWKVLGTGWGRPYSWSVGGHFVPFSTLLGERAVQDQVRLGGPWGRAGQDLQQTVTVRVPRSSDAAPHSGKKQGRNSGCTVASIQIN